MSVRRRLGKALTRMGFRRSWEDRCFSAARRWSNRELARLAPLFSGDVVNVSAWEDKDKEGRRYADYFPGKRSYTITNYGTEQGVLQGREDELFLDLEKPLDPALERRFDVVFNHTTLEHVWDFRTAFAHLCALSADIVILVVPWIQPQHTDYGDFWRFSPQALARLFDEEGFTTLYLSWGRGEGEAVYVFGIGTRKPETWRDRFAESLVDPSAPGFLKLPPDYAGRRLFPGAP
ncbi:hypothetical protein [Prosthecomicrobium sp. N25]|uniref:hypothetical protein n=1 Tax=Prosthecomicrobium sp. N25 TaxID=3129254 RepID=UPI0030782B87